MLDVNRYLIHIDSYIQSNKALVPTNYILRHYNGTSNWNNIIKNAHILLF